MSEERGEYKIEGRPSTIFRVAKTPNNPYVMIDKRIIDNKDLSFKAKGILTYLLSRPDGWEVNLADLAKRGTDGVDAVKSGVKELKEAGYLKHAGTRKATGQFETVIWEVYEAPQVDNPLTVEPYMGVSPEVEKPHVGNPHVGNQGQVLSTLSNKELNNIKDNKQLPEILAFTDHFGHFNGKREEGRWITLFQAIGACRAEEIAAWAERQEIHMTNRGRLMDSLETAAKKWTDPPSGPKYSKESFAERVMRS